MAIRIKDNSSSVTGRLSSAIGTFSPSFSGEFSNDAPASITGSLQRALGSFRPRFIDSARRWHPGHYVKTQGNHARSDDDAYIAGVKNDIDKVTDLGLLKGALVAFSWGKLNPTGSTFDWSSSDEIFDYISTAAPNQDKLIIELPWKAFTSSISNAVIGPADLLSEHRQETKSGWIMAMYREVVLNRFLEFVTAFADRYESDSRLEIVTTPESAPSYGSAFIPSDYTRGQLADAYDAIAVHFSQHFQTTNSALNLNSLSGQVSGMLENAYQNAVGMHSPDLATSPAEQLFIGESASGEVPVRDYRGTISHSTLASFPVLSPNGKDYVGPPATLISEASTRGVTHLAWVTTVSEPDHTWTDVQAAIAADPDSLATSCPTQYNACDLT